MTLRLAGQPASNGEAAVATLVTWRGSLHPDGRCRSSEVSCRLRGGLCYGMRVHGSILGRSDTGGDIAAHISRALQAKSRQLLLAAIMVAFA